MKWLIILILTLPFVYGEIGYNYERNCYTPPSIGLGNDKPQPICEINVYPYRKYWDLKTAEVIDESFYPCEPTISNEDFCTNEYIYWTQAKSSGLVQHNIKGQTLGLQLTKFIFMSPSIDNKNRDGSILKYNIADGVDLEFQNLWNRNVKTFIINITKIKKFIQMGKTYDISFQLTGNHKPIYDNPFAWDDNEVLYLNYTIHKGIFNLEIPSDWLLEDYRQEIVYIDPTIILNSSNMTYDAIVWNRYDLAGASQTYKSNEAPVNMRSGGNKVCRMICPSWVNIYRAFMEFPTDIFPKNVDTIIEFNWSVRQINNPTIDVHTIYVLNANHTHHPDNMTHWNSTVWNGTVVANYTFSGAGQYRNISLENATDHLKDYINNDKGVFVLSLKQALSEKWNPNFSIYDLRIGARNHATNAFRYKFVIRYNLTDCIYTGSGDWVIRDFCNLNESVDVSGSIHINESGQLNISDNVEILTDQIVIDGLLPDDEVLPGNWRLSWGDNYSLGG